ncbi:MAG: alanine/glycine:cation symporter family protein [Lachnospiraceae bacterium]|nr:alanine/glycine:cation symporter family protein [Lachnospiraceae bacterium]
MEQVLSTINNALWSMPLVILIVGAGLYFSIKMGFPQIRLFKEMIRATSTAGSSDKGLSPLKSFVFTSARSVGVGNISGMAAALFFGGPGSLFWLWILAVFGCTVAGIEGILAQTYKEEINGEFRGGPAFYMRKGIKNPALGKTMAALYAIVIVIGIVFLMSPVQSYNIANGISSAFHVPTIAVGVAFSILIAVVVFGGLKRIGDVANKIFPFMALAYVALALIVIVTNISEVPKVIALIFKSAFGIDPIMGAIVGTAITRGVQRGVFANEVGQGTSAITAATSTVNHPAKQGLIGSLSVFIGTFFVCTPSVIMMLMTGCYNVQNPAGGFLYEGLPGVETGNGYVSASINTIIPGIGEIFVAVAILLFAFVALLAYYHYSESNLAYLVGGNKTAVLILRICFVACIFMGTLLKAEVIWTMGDIAAGAQCWINIIAVFLLGNIAVKIFKDYDRQKKNGVTEPVFDPDTLGIKNASDIWKK